ncbi:MAG: transporter substrate-binding domain-containing protein [Gammaproteobacteria bacterium]|nr:transporter substrate-binding domain-containing protein [Gammaproteobacteria bacterium]
MNINSIIYSALLWVITGLSCMAETQLHISSGFTPPVSDFFNSVLTEADKRMKDVSISFEILPAERSLILVNQGINDADCCRIPALLAQEYKNIIPVDISFFSARFSAFSKKNDVPIKSFTDLKPFSVGSVEGWKIAVNKIKEINPAVTHIVTTPEQLFLMLEQDRLDYGVVGYLSGLKTIADLKLNNIHALEPPLEEKQLYLVVHNKHKNLIPLFNEVLNEMKNDGTINSLYSELISSL